MQFVCTGVQQSINFDDLVRSLMVHHHKLARGSVGLVLKSRYNISLTRLFIPEHAAAEHKSCCKDCKYRHIFAMNVDIIVVFHIRGNTPVPVEISGFKQEGVQLTHNVCDREAEESRGRVQTVVRPAPLQPSRRR